MKAHHWVAGAGRTRLAVDAAGPTEAPLVLLVHGWAQSARCWQHQLADPGLTAGLRVAALDLRGHGRSEQPRADRGGYGDPAVWAGDLDATVTALTPGRAVLVGWSYGGLVIADYLARHGTGRTAGVLLVGAVTGIGRGVGAGRVGPAMRAALPDALAEDPAVAVPALAAFVAAMAARPLPGTDEQAMLGAALATPPAVRAALFDRHADGSALAAVLTAGAHTSGAHTAGAHTAGAHTSGAHTTGAGTAGAHTAGARTAGSTAAGGCAPARPVPVLVLHGTADRVVDPATAEHHLATLPGARADWWAGTGHVPFAEDPARFNRALRAFATDCMV